MPCAALLLHGSRVVTKCPARPSPACRRWSRRAVPPAGWCRPPDGVPLLSARLRRLSDGCCADAYSASSRHGASSSLLLGRQSWPSRQDRTRVWRGQWRSRPPSASLRMAAVSHAAALCSDREPLRLLRNRPSSTFEGARHHHLARRRTPRMPGRGPPFKFAHDLPSRLCARRLLAMSVRGERLVGAAPASA